MFTHPGWTVAFIITSPTIVRILQILWGLFSVIVIITETVCRVHNNVEDVVSIRRTVHLSCSMNLLGHCQPSMEWRLDNGTRVNHNSWGGSDSYNRTVSSEINFTMNSDDENISFIFTARFSCPTRDFNSHNLSTVNPKYKYVWKSQPINVLCWVSNTSDIIIFARLTMKQRC